MSTYKKRERRQVSFNTEDAVELELLKFADREDINFSGLVKNLLFAYKMGQLQPREISASVRQPERPLTTNMRNKGSMERTAGLSQIKASGMPFDF
ncbi:hypothetical protein [Lihuaxuella thermophila]|uniref:Uncharacterized protein n=1 Tax=Lihuaxuella thermophila TaxID=1173111 RepID=A0A1H8BIF4_9BACL|nr:hypothetical protein [Lihuaxuella thermophila]SEM81798.1 hypothetical protein SAMN05444955_102167 [Lihuaxuella thermophila]